MINYNKNKKNTKKRYRKCLEREGKKIRNPRKRNEIKFNYYNFKFDI